MGSSMSRTLFLTLAAATGAIASERSFTSLWPVDECTGKSLYIPSWVISQFSRTRSGAAASFTLTNRVTESSSSITCQDDDQCIAASSDNSEDNDHHVQVTVKEVEENAVRVTVEEAWTCRDKKTRAGEPKAIHFKATGNTTLSLDCGSGEGAHAQTCASAQDVDLIRGALTEPLHLAMLESERHAESSTSATCPALMTLPSWNLTNISYQNNTAGNPWVGPLVGRWFTMEIVNLASGDVAACSDAVAYNPYDPPQSKSGSCWRDPSASWQEDAGTGQLWTDYDFDEVTHDITLKQTWYCDQPKTMKAFIVNGNGTAHVDLQCETYDSGQGGPNNNNTRCTSPAVGSRTGELISREEIPPFSIQDPYPYHIDNFTVRSMVDPYVRIVNGKLDIVAREAGGGEEEGEGGNDDLEEAVISFTLWTMEYSFYDIRANFTILSGTPDPPSEELWMSCKALDFDPECRFRYDYATSEIEIVQDWYTSRKDNWREIKFNGTAKGTLHRSCSENESDDGRVCTFDETILDLENVQYELNPDPEI
ncbi:hypothetical protein F4778DRAFT_765079 [Xylariomycetidae sp. FL2044]|nr:hypothetical protein F4778DRAFT_765079 [Xylariomycetidae sp. FL2044]